MNVAFVYMNIERNVARGAGYVAGAVRRTGHGVTFYDTLYTPVDQVAAEAAAADILMISTMTMLFPEALRLIRQVKARRDIPVLMGGIHPTIVGPGLLEEHPEIDYLCLGEGEAMVSEFLEKLGTDGLWDIPNLAFRRDGRVVANPIRPAAPLDNLPAFPWEYFDDRSVVQDNGFLYTDATRGCPYNCTYCCNGIYLKQYGKDYLRHRPVGEVLEELEHLRDRYRPRIFYFGDEMILFDKEYARELFTQVRRRVGAPYGFMARVEHIDEEIAALLKETGCRFISMGVECGDEEFRRKHLNRFMSNAQIEKAFEVTRRAGIFRTSFNMIGYPFDDDDRLTESSIALNERLRPDYVQVTVFYPFPGTKLYHYCLDNNLIDQEKAARVTNYGAESILVGKDVEEARRRFVNRFNPYGQTFGRSRLGLAASHHARKAYQWSVLTAAGLLPPGLKRIIKRALGRS